MIVRFIGLCWIAHFAALGYWQLGRGRWGWVLFNLLMVISGVWFYVESIIDDIKTRK